MIWKRELSFGSYQSMFRAKRIGLALTIASVCLCLGFVFPAAADPTTITQPALQIGLGTLEAAALSPDGKTHITAGSGGIQIWDAQTGVLSQKILENVNRSPSLAISSDGGMFATAGEDGIYIYNAITRSLAKILQKADLVGWGGLAFSPLGSQIASSSHLFDHDGNAEYYLRFWNIASGESWDLYPPNQAEIASFDWSSDGKKIIVAYGYREAQIWDVEKRIVLRTYKGFPAAIHSVAFSPHSSKVLFGGADGIARLYDTASTACLRTYQGHSGPILAIAFNPVGGSILTGGADGTARLWDAASTSLLHVFKPTLGSVHSVGFSSGGGKILTGCKVGAKIWNSASKTLLASSVPGGHTSGINSVAFSPDGTRLLTGGDTTARLWDRTTGANIRVYSGHAEKVAEVAFSPDGSRILTCGYDHTMRLWDSNSTACLRIYNSDYPSHAAFAPSGSYFATGSFSIKIWDANSTACLRNFGDDDILALAISLDSTKIASAHWGGYCKLWNVETAALLATFSDASLYMGDVAFSPDGKRLLTGGAKGAKMWDIASAKIVSTFGAITPPHQYPWQCVDFSPTGRHIVIGEKDASLWRSGGECQRIFRGHVATINSVVFSPDSNQILTGGDDGIAFLWNAEPTTAARNWWLY